VTGGIRNAIIGASALTLLATTFAQASESPVEPQRNPFERPAAEALIKDAAVLNSRSTETQEPYLRAVLVAGSKSVVDFGGVILQIGESANGYRLLSVEEGRATFRREDKKIAFSVYAEESRAEQ
jgi:hypothetical protein